MKNLKLFFLTLALTDLTGTVIIYFLSSHEVFYGFGYALAMAIITGISAGIPNAVFIVILSKLKYGSGMFDKFRYLISEIVLFNFAFIGFDKLFNRIIEPWSNRVTNLKGYYIYLASISSYFLILISSYLIILIIGHLLILNKRKRQFR